MGFGGRVGRRLPPAAEREAERHAADRPLREAELRRRHQLRARGDEDLQQLGRAREHGAAARRRQKCRGCDDERAPRRRRTARLSRGDTPTARIAPTLTSCPSTVERPRARDEYRRARRRDRLARVEAAPHRPRGGLLPGSAGREPPLRWEVASSVRRAVLLERAAARRPRPARRSPRRRARRLAHAARRGAPRRMDRRATRAPRRRSAKEDALGARERPIASRRRARRSRRRGRAAQRAHVAVSR